MQDLSSHREMYKEKTQLAVSAARTLQKKLQSERETSTALRQDLNIARDQCISCQQAFTILQSELQAGIFSAWELHQIERDVGHRKMPQLCRSVRSVLLELKFT